MPEDINVTDEQHWRCPACGSGSDEHRVERDGPESIDMVVCQRCGATWLPRPVEAPAPTQK
jgi:uncharacterized Zn finger protein